jgi:hypothetical protein
MHHKSHGDITDQIKTREKKSARNSSASASKVIILGRLCQKGQFYKCKQRR